MKCVLVSFFNSNNIGDVVIGDMLNKIISKNCNVENLSYSGNLIVSPSQTLEPSFFKLKRFLLEKLRKLSLEKIIKIYYKSFKKDNLDIFEEKIKVADFLVIGGGNMIFDLDENSNSVLRFNQFVELTKKHKKIVFAISLGIGPFKTKQQEINAVNSLSKCDYITFRDLDSLKIFKKHNQFFKNVYLTIDPVFLVPKRLKYENTSKDVVVGLNIINNKLISEDLFKYNQIISQYANLANKLVQQLNVKLVLFCTESLDYDAVTDVFSKIKNKDNIMIYDVKGYDELMALYDGLSLIVGTRMHSMILAHTQQIPVVGLSYQNKVNMMFDIIESKDSLFTYDNISNDVDLIVNKCHDILQNLEEEKNRISSNLIKIIKKNIINEEILLEITNSINQ